MYRALSREYRRSAMLLALAALPRLAAAQQPEPPAAPTLVFAASRYAQTLAEAPASVTVISREEILRFGYRNLGEILGAARGLFASYDRNYTYMTVRGLSRPGDFNTRILLMLNGHRLNGAVADDGLMGSEAVVDVAAIERIEVISGPGSSLFGTNALYGVVNIVTRSGRSLEGAEVGAESRSFGTWAADASYGRRYDSGIEVFASGSVLRSDGPDLYYPEFDAPTTNNGRAVGVDGDGYEKGLLTAQVGDFRAEASYSGRRKEIPTASFGTLFNDPRASTRDRVAIASLNFEHPFTDLSRLWTSLTYTWSRYDGAYPYSPALLRDYASANVWTLEGQYLRYVGDRHKFSVGGELRRNRRLDQGVYDEQPPFAYLADARQSWVWAAFVQSELRLASRLTLYAGLRHDQYEVFGGSTNPRGALVFALTPRTSLKAMYGRAFRAPNPYELYYNDGGLTQKPAPALTPEHVESYEFAANHDFSAALRGSLSLYRVTVSNLIGVTTDPADSLLVFVNGSGARTTGAEAELEAHTSGGVLGRLSYAYQQATDLTLDAAPVNSPRHVARLALSAPVLRDHLTASGELRYLSRRPSRGGAGVPAYVTANATLRVRPARTGPLELYASVYNLLGAVYGDAGGEEHVQDVIRQDGRTFRLGARASF